MERVSIQSNIQDQDIYLKPEFIEVFSITLACIPIGALIISILRLKSI